MSSKDEGGEELLLCYNRGCGQQFKESENTPTSCRFHPGTPYFHDAYKGWTCCRKSTDFTEFLNMKGCATSFHTNEKPPEEEKKKPEVSSDAVIEVCQPKYVPLPRPSLDTQMNTLSVSMSDSLKKQTYGEQDMAQKGEGSAPEIKVGITQCVNKGCTTKYEGPDSDLQICKYHPGVPIFHEGLKYWSCCQKKTTEFDVFLKQLGCTTGTHLWVKPKESTIDGEGSEIVKCRNDWHQDGTHVIQVVYAGGKKFDPNLSTIKANPVKLSVELFFPEQNGYYREEWILAGVIKPGDSSVFMTPMKIEIKMKKAEPVKWTTLDIPKRKVQDAVAQEEEGIKSVGVEPVDLSDL